MLIIGMGFFQLGAEIAMTPLGEGIGVQISKTRRLIMILLIVFVMGVIITISEPDLQVLAVAFDSGGVASGPMTSTFLLPLSIGVCQATARSVLVVRRVKDKPEVRVAVHQKSSLAPEGKQIVSLLEQARAAKGKRRDECSR